MITEAIIQVTDRQATAGWTSAQKTEARRNGTMPKRDEVRYVISGTIESIGRDDRGYFVTVIDGTEVHSTTQLLGADYSVPGVGDTFEVTTSLVSGVYDTAL